MTCTYRGNIFETDWFYLTSLHILSVIQVPLHVLGTYIILAKTPKKMGKIKGSMLVLHLCETWFDLYLSLLTVPVLILSINSGYPLGILYGIVSTWLLTYIGFLSVVVLCTSITMFFENRYNYLVRTDSETRSRKIKRVINYALNYLFCLLSFAPIFWNTEEVHGFREIIRQKESCLPLNVINNPRLYMVNTTSSMFLSCTLISLAFFLCQCFLFFGLTAYYIINVKTLSKQTSEMQKLFFKALCIQIAIPFVIICTPVFYIIYVFSTGSMDIMLMNGVIALLSAHGLASTVVMLRVHEPYRNAVSDIFKLRKVKLKTPFAIFVRSRSSVYN